MKLKAEDLSVGNFVYTNKTEDKAIKIWDSIFVDMNEGLIEIKPIPLTEEWHNKFGVEINGFMSFVYELPRNNTIKVKVVFNGDYVYLRQENDDKAHNDSLVTIWNTDLTKRDMYVHEWQNWYKLLSGGEELIVK